MPLDLLKSEGLPTRGERVSHGPSRKLSYFNDVL